MALWTGAFMKQTSQAGELTRQRIIQEERCGRMPSQEHIPKPEYMDMVRGVPGARTVRDPWAPSGRPRESKPPPIMGYGGTIPKVRTEHLGIMQSEAQARYVPHAGSAATATTQRMAPGGGSSALGTAPMPMPGQRTVTGMGIYQSLEVVRSMTS